MSDEPGRTGSIFSPAERIAHLRRAERRLRPFRSAAVICCLALMGAYAAGEPDRLGWLIDTAGVGLALLALALQDGKDARLSSLDDLLSEAGRQKVRRLKRPLWAPLAGLAVGVLTLFAANTLLPIIRPAFPYVSAGACLCIVSASVVAWRMGRAVRAVYEPLLSGAPKA